MCETKTTSDFLSLLDEAQEFLLNRFADSETIPSMIEKLEKVHNEWVMETTDDSLELVLSIDKTKLFITSLLKTRFPNPEIVHFIMEWYTVKKNLKTLQLKLDGDFELVERLAADIKMNLKRIDREIGKLIDTSKDWYIEEGLQITKEKIEEFLDGYNWRIIIDSALIDELKNGLKSCEELFARKVEFLKKEEEAKLDELEIAVPNDSQKLRNEMMEHFASQAQHMENRISETNEKMESMNRKLAHFSSSFNEKFNSMQLDKKIVTISIQKNREEDLKGFLTKIGDKFNEQQVEMKLRAEWLDRKMEKMMETMIRTAATLGSAGPGTIGDSQNISPLDANIIGPISSQSNPIDDAVQSPDPAKTVDEPSSEDDELQKMEDQFRKDLAEQTRVYEMKLRNVREQRREMNVRIELNMKI